MFRVNLHLKDEIYVYMAIKPVNLFVYVCMVSAFTMPFLFLDVGGNSLAGLLSKGSFCLFSNLRSSPFLPGCLRLYHYGRTVRPDWSYWGIHRSAEAIGTEKWS